jgi:hypothetical protein
VKCLQPIARRHSEFAQFSYSVQLGHFSAPLTNATDSDHSGGGCVHGQVAVAPRVCAGRITVRFVLPLPRSSFNYGQHRR